VVDFHVLLIGDTERSEFRAARASLAALARVSIFADTDKAAATLDDEQLAPQLIVLAQSYPGQFSAAAVDRLRHRAPLARVIVLLGSCCEGEMRSGRPLPGAVRVYWHQWPARCRQELRRLIDGQSSGWALPATATEEERSLAAASHPLPRRQGLIVIHTRRAVMEDWLSAACRACGFSTVWLRLPHFPRARGASAVLFDGGECRSGDLEELKRLGKELAPAPVIALLDFPRIDDCERALAAGAAVVLSKPLHLEDLCGELP
jgi:DNA-binding NarL/FixJ family response regulator